MLLAQRLHHVDHDADGAGLLHRAIGQCRAHAVATGKKGAIQVAGAVHQQQGFLGFCHIVHFACAEYGQWQKSAIGMALGWAASRRSHRP
jgi:hypothetical protein